MKLILSGTIALSTLACTAHAATLEPASILPSSITFEIEEVGQIGPVGDEYNFASPTVIGGDLYFIDQYGKLSRNDLSGSTVVLDSSNAPAGLTLSGREAILNVAAGNGTDVFVTFTSSTLPTGVVAQTIPTDPAYSSIAYHVVYKYTLDATGALVAPQQLAALETVTRGHKGGGMLVLPDGDLVLATGDNLRFDRDGLSAPQLDSEHLSKLLIIDSETGAVTVAAKGVRNVQQLTYVDGSQSQIVFGDIGASTAEEVNIIDVADLVDLTEIENFGWGRNVDGNAREGTFYIDDGATSNPGTKATAIGEAPIPEAGFIQPFAQFGRPEGQSFIAITGPISSEVSFDTIDLLFGDLNTGGLYATRDGFDSLLNDVFAVSLVDTGGIATSLLALSGGDRADPRFFNFADGSAGVLLEGTGRYYLLREVSLGVVPLTGTFGFTLFAFGSFAVARRHRK